MNSQTTQRGDVAFSGVRFDVRVLELEQHDGGTVRREVVVPSNAVVILPVLRGDRGDQVVLIRNRRFAVDQTLWELPAGTIEDGEQPDDCAARELTEETGYRAAKLTPVIEFYPTPGFCTEKMHAYLAEDLQYVGQNLDPTERIEPKVIDFDEALAMIRDNHIRDGKTIATLLYYTQFLRSET